MHMVDMITGGSLLPPGHPQEAPAIVGPVCSSRPPPIATHLTAQPRTGGWAVIVFLFAIQD